MEKEKTWLAEEAKKHDKGKHLEREKCGQQRKIKTKIDNDEKEDNILRWKNIFFTEEKKNGEGKGKKSIGDGNERTRTHGIVKRVLEFLTRNSHYTDYL